MHIDHPNVILVKEKADNQNKFLIKQVSLCDIIKQIKDINFSKDLLYKSNYCPVRVLPIV